jgi:hypothetical protein
VDNYYSHQDATTKHGFSKLTDTDLDRSHEGHFQPHTQFGGERELGLRRYEMTLGPVYTTVEKASGRSRMLGQDMVI